MQFALPGDPPPKGKAQFSPEQNHCEPTKGFAGVRSTRTGGWDYTYISDVGEGIKQIWCLEDREVTTQEFHNSQRT